MTDALIEEVLDFWFEECTPKQWFMKDDSFDATVGERFGALYGDVAAGKHPEWRDSAQGCLAEVIVTDQFPRNIFRDDPKSFATDAQARFCMRHAIEMGFDRELSRVGRNFLYMPLQHSEDAEDQAWGIELYGANGDEDTLDYAHRHKAIIDRFGRFPHRNAVLGRDSTPEETEFLTRPGSSF